LLEKKKKGAVKKGIEGGTKIREGRVTLLLGSQKTQKKKKKKKKEKKKKPGMIAVDKKILLPVSCMIGEGSGMR